MLIFTHCHAMQIVALLRNCFLSRVSTLTRDIDIANLSVCPSVRLSVRPSVRP